MHSPDQRVTSDGRGLLQLASSADPQGTDAVLRMIDTFAQSAPPGLQPAIDDANGLRAKSFVQASRLRRRVVNSAFTRKPDLNGAGRPRLLDSPGCWALVPHRRTTA